MVPVPPPVITATRPGTWKRLFASTGTEDMVTGCVKTGGGFRLVEGVIH